MDGKDIKAERTHVDSSGNRMNLYNDTILLIYADTRKNSWKVVFFQSIIFLLSPIFGFGACIISKLFNREIRFSVKNGKLK